MGTATLSFQTGTNPALTYSVAVADTDMARITTAMAAQHFPQGVLVTPMSVDAHGVITPATYRAPTPAEVMTAAASAIVNQIIQTAVNYEKQAALTAATAGIAPIIATP